MYRRIQKKPVKKASPKNTNSIVSPSLDADYKESVSSQSYLGKKGYTIPKSVLTEEDLEYLKTELYVKPQTFGAVGGGAEVSSFPVFRENTNKLYLPRFYGIQRYGLPPRSEIEPGDDLDIPFVNTLRDYQDKIVGIYTDYVNKPICKEGVAKGGGGILEVPCGRGKCLGRDTPILMSDGTIKMVQNVRVGDLLMGDDSKPRKVLSLARGIEKMAHICQENTDFRYVTNMSHILSLKHVVTGEVLDLSIEQYLSSEFKQDLLGYRVPIQFPETPMDILDAYKTGYYLNNFTKPEFLDRCA